jgi:glyoxylase-like metal-dependent hydrolase (beta-lactamase superfamily II)
MTRGAAMTGIGSGVFRLGTMWANFYLVADGREATLNDAGHPRYSAQLDDALDRLGARRSAVIVTHHHVDHAGTAEHARAEHGATVYVHAEDRQKVAGERQVGHSTCRWWTARPGRPSR